MSNELKPQIHSTSDLLSYPEQEGLEQNLAHYLSAEELILLKGMIHGLQLQAITKINDDNFSNLRYVSRLLGSLVDCAITEKGVEEAKKAVFPKS